LAALTTVRDFNLNPASYDCEEYTASHTDWRLANRKEFLSLVDRSKAAYGDQASLPEGHPFIEVTGSAYWTATTDQSSSRTNSAFTFFASGALTIQSKTVYSNRIWPIRGTPPCPADLDNDGDVDGSDIDSFLEDWPRTDCCEAEVDPCKADLDGSCSVDASDLAAFCLEFGRENCPID
jgi:hypothetical protein